MGPLLARLIAGMLLSLGVLHGPAAPAPSPLPPLTVIGRAPAQPPPALLDRVRAHAAARAHTGLSNVAVTAVSPETWPDGCFGLGQPDRVCAQYLVNGWRVLVTVPGGQFAYRLSAEAFVPEP